jgi:DNA invertase Pin-like site-specific DNA recombinase
MKQLAVCYYRISKNTGDNERQINDVETYCKANDIEIIKDFQEKISGSKRKRPATIALFSYLETTKVNFVIVSELSRFGRTNEVLELVEKLDAMNICLISLKENLKTLDSNPSEQSKSRLILNIWTGLNNYELATISYRIKSGRDYAVMNKGSWGGSNHYNYGYMTENSKLIINIQESEIVKLIYSKLIEGWGCIKIANYLNSQNILTRSQLNGNPLKKWVRTTVYQILTNKIYIGIRKWQKEEFAVPELRIISDYTFNEVQKKLRDRKTNSQEFSKLQKYSYLFDKGLIRCGKCGKTYVGVHQAGSYKCHSGRFSRGCGNPSVRINWIEETIQTELSENWINIVLMGVKGSDTTSLKISLDLQIQEITKLESRLSRIKELYIDGNYSKLEFEMKTSSTTELLNKSKSLVEALEEQIHNTVASPVLEMLNGELTEEKIKSLRFPKEILRNIITGIIVNEKNINVSLIRGFEFSIKI